MKELNLHDYLLDITQLDHIVTRYLIPFAFHVLGSFLVWIVGGMAVRGLQKLFERALDRRRIDPTLVFYANSTLGLVLKGLLLLAILGIFGIETTSFSAILAAAGVAIGVAWSGLLANFAAGIFLVIFRPFVIGDVITAGGVTGSVREIGLFATSIDNGENLKVIVPNNKLFSDNILNYSTNAYRVMTIKIQVPREVDPVSVISLLIPELQKVPNLVAGQKVGGDITEFNIYGTLITMRLPCHNSQYGSVWTEANRVVYQALKTNKIPTSESRSILIQPGPTA